MAGLTIPLYQQSVGVQEGQAPAVPNLTTPPPSAFGTEIAASTERTGQEIEKIGADLGEHMIQQKKIAQDSQVNAAELQGRKQLENTMYSTTPDENGKVGVFNRLLGDAHGATQDYDAQAAKVTQDAVDSVDSPYAKRQILDRMNDANFAYRRFVIHHEATQINSLHEQTLQANLQQDVDQAGMFGSDPDGFKKAVEQSHMKLYTTMKNLGYSDDMISAGMDKHVSDMAVSAMKDSMANDPDQAQKFFDQIEDSMSPKAQYQIQRALDTAQKQYKDNSGKILNQQYNDSEAPLAGKMANGQLTQVDLDHAKSLPAGAGGIDREYYELASTALKNVGTSSADPKVQASTFQKLTDQLARIPVGDQDSRNKQMIQFRKDIMAHVGNLDSQQFSTLLGFSDPNFIKAIQPQKMSAMQAGLAYIKTAYSNFKNSDATGAIANFVKQIGGLKAADIPQAARDAVQGDALKENPALVGHQDLSNFSVNQNGINQVTSGQTNLKPTQKISAPSQQDQDAIAWAHANQKDPRAAQILQKNGIK